MTEGARSPKDKANVRPPPNDDLTAQQDGSSRKSRRTRWGQSAYEGAQDNNATHTPEPEPQGEVADVRAAAAAAAAMVMARTGATGVGVPRSVLLNTSLNPSDAPAVGRSEARGIGSVLSDVAARTSAARMALEKAKRALALKKQIQEQMAALKAQRLGAIPGLGNASAMLSAGVAAALRSLPRATPVKFDSLGRELDDEGQVVDMKPMIHSTLKVNINKEREQKLKQVTHQTRIDRTLTNPTLNTWYDPSMVGGGGSRPKRKGLCFVERGFFTQKERRLRSRMQAEALGYQVSTEAKEAQKLREAQEEEKLRRLLKYQRDTNKSIAKDDGAASEEGDSADEDPNAVPLGKGAGFAPPVTAATSLQAAPEAGEAAMGDVASDDDDSDDIGYGRRQQPLHLLQRKQIGIIPEYEWWDAALLEKCAENDSLGDPSFPYVILETSLTNLVEHPIPIPPVIDPLKPVAPITVLTPKERAKLRRRKKQEKERDKQDQIRMGLIAPPPPKVKLSNLARVLGTSAAADPSKVESQVRQQMEQRLKDHEARNEARRLDDDARRKKRISQWTRPSKDGSVPTEGAKVCVYSVKDLSDRRQLFKVDKNAQQFHVTGAAILCPGVGNLIVVEGSDKALKGYKKLLLRRMRWGAENQTEGDEATMDLGGAADASGVATSPGGDDADDGHSLFKMKGNAYCHLLWEGIVKERGFKQWRVYVCKSELEARKLLADREAEHYWDMLKKYRDPVADL